MRFVSYQLKLRSGSLRVLGQYDIVELVQNALDSQVQPVGGVKELLIFSSHFYCDAKLLTPFCHLLYTFPCTNGDSGSGDGRHMINARENYQCKTDYIFH